MDEEMDGWILEFIDGQMDGDNGSQKWNVY